MNLDGNAASVREVCDAGLLAGALTVVWQRGEVLQLNEIGYRDVDAGLPMQRDTLFRIASMTKPVTVAAVPSRRRAPRTPMRATGATASTTRPRTPMKQASA